MNSFFCRCRQLIYEFFRNFLVSGIAFIIDFSILYLSREFLFFYMGPAGILLAAVLGYTAGLIFNFIFSFTFVFRQIDEKAKQHKIRSFVLFVIIAMIGLVMTEICMYAGIKFIGEKWYMVIKIFTAGIVLFWNYLGKKFFIFKGAKYGDE